MRGETDLEFPPAVLLVAGSAMIRVPRVRFLISRHHFGSVGGWQNGEN